MPQIKTKILAPFLSFEDTLKCNLNCVMCSNPKETEKNPLTKKEIIKMIKNISPSVKSIIFSGGEPTIDPYLEEYIDNIPKNKQITILTNGTTLKNKKIINIIGKIHTLRVSIDDHIKSEKSLYRSDSNPRQIYKIL